MASPSHFEAINQFVEEERVTIVDIYFSGGIRESTSGEGGTNENDQVVITIVIFFLHKYKDTYVSPHFIVQMLM